MLTVKHRKIDAIEGLTAKFIQCKKIGVRSLLCMILMVFWGNGVNAQIYEIIDYKKRKVIADSLMNELKTGALVIRLKTKHKKLTTLNKALNNENLSDKQRKRAKKIIETTIKERDEFNQEIVSAFHDSYDYSKFYIIHDTSSLHLKNGTKQGIFLNKEMEIDPNINFTAQTYFIFGEGSANSRSIVIDGLTVTTSEGVLPDRPFPSFFNIPNRGKFFLFKMFSNRRPGEKIIQEVMDKFNAF